MEKNYENDSKNCLLLIHFLSLFCENPPIGTVEQIELKNRKCFVQVFSFANLTVWLEILLAYCFHFPDIKLCAGVHNKAENQVLATTKKYFKDLIMIDSKREINSLTASNHSFHVKFDVFLHYIAIMLMIKRKCTLFNKSII